MALASLFLSLQLAETRRILREREGEVAEGEHYGPQVRRTRFEDLVSLICEDYVFNDRKSQRRLNDYINHLTSYFKQLRASDITTAKIGGLRSEADLALPDSSALRPTC